VDALYALAAIAMTTVRVQLKIKAKRISAITMSTNVGMMLNSISYRFTSEQSSNLVVRVGTSRVRFMAAPLSRILNTSPVLRRTWKDKERFKRWSNAS